MKQAYRDARNATDEERAAADYAGGALSNAEPYEPTPVNSGQHSWRASIRPGVRRLTWWERVKRWFAGRTESREAANMSALQFDDTPIVPQPVFPARCVDARDDSFAHCA